MTQDSLQRARELTETIDDALKGSPALTDQLIGDVKRLRAEVRDLCRQGREDDAVHCVELAINIIKTGAPVPE